jgi:hypothetical protein
VRLYQHWPEGKSCSDLRRVLVRNDPATWSASLPPNS